MNAVARRSRALVAPLLMLSAVAGASEELAVKYACVACHEIDFKKVGPAFEEVAKKYRGANEQTVAMLVKHVREGSTGIWGKDIMPPQPLVPEAEARTLVQWVLTLGQ